MDSLNKTKYAIDEELRTILVCEECGVKASELFEIDAEIMCESCADAELRRQMLKESEKEFNEK